MRFLNPCSQIGEGASFARTFTVGSLKPQSN
jgi:hypothetical protein